MRNSVRLRLGSNAAVAALLLLPGAYLRAQTEGQYVLRMDQPHQVIKGLGFEIQSDSINSGNAGMPDAVTSVPHDLTEAEKHRFYREMLHGFRYTRLAMGLYLRGLDAEQKHIVERFPGQMADLKAMQDESGIEGFDVEYWSPPPFWKQNKSYYGGTVGPVNDRFVDAFSDALVQDVKYLRAHGLKIAQWGLQNEPVEFHHAPAPSSTAGATPGASGDKAQSYAHCFYSPQDYTTVLRSVVPKLRANFSGLHIHANSWDGPAGPHAAEIRKYPELLKQIDAWTWHQVSHNSNDQIRLRDTYLRDAGGKPVYQNEFEYQPWDKQWTTDQYFMNTGQALMNWMAFEDSPIWYWIHALKPVTNLEATGYALGFWRPEGPLQSNLSPQLAPGHWEFNPKNWNAVAGFLKYLGWDSRRYAVEESSVQLDQRILAWRTKEGKLSLAFSNRGKVPYTFHVSGVPARTLTGHRYTVTTLDTPVGTRQIDSNTLAITIQPQSYEFWVESTRTPTKHDTK